MAYRVEMSAPAEADAYAAYRRIRDDAPNHADRWLVGLFEVVLSLREMPHRGALIPEAQQLGRPIRQLHYGKRTGVYRILFDIEEDAHDGPRVRVLRIWHGSRDRISASDLVDDGPAAQD